MRKNNSWIKPNGKFQCRSIRQVEDYIKYISGLTKVSVSRTPTFLNIVYVLDDKMLTHKIRMRAGLYSLTEFDFKSLFEEMYYLVPAYSDPAGS